MARRVDREGPVHRAVVTYLRAVLRPGYILHHSPNEGVRGGQRGALDGQRRKDMGQLAGFPDLVLIADGRTFFIEVKAEGGRMSEAQREFQRLAEEQGIPYAVCRSVQDARETLAEWGVKTRERVETRG